MGGQGEAAGPEVGRRLMQGLDGRGVNPGMNDAFRIIVENGKWSKKWSQKVKY